MLQRMQPPPLLQFPPYDNVHPTAVLVITSKDTLSNVYFHGLGDCLSLALKWLKWSCVFDFIYLPIPFPERIEGPDLPPIKIGTIRPNAGEWPFIVDLMTTIQFGRRDKHYEEVLGAMKLQISIRNRRRCGSTYVLWGLLCTNLWIVSFATSGTRPKNTLRTLSIDIL